MATLEELLKEYDLVGNEGQTKTASAKPTATAEIDQVLETLGLTGSADTIEKVANSNENKGEHMSLTGIYEEIFGESAPVAGQEKVAASAEAEEVNEASQLFGELTAHYFESAHGAFIEKMAADLVSEAGAGEQPMAHLDNDSPLGKTMGKAKDPSMPVNHSASSGKGMQVATGGTSPYSLKEMALKKQILKGMAAAPVGDIKD